MEKFTTYEQRLISGKNGVKNYQICQEKSY